jgi:glyoxylase-like metal-dependent hydrolase (beta-lactamase superfamily II)
LLEGERILFAGDMLSDVDPPILADTPDVAAAYLESLKTLESLIQQVRVLIPGHGSACDKDEAMWRLERDRRYLDIVTKAIEHIMPTDIAARTTALLDDPRLGWDEGQNAHLSNIEAILRYR